jgi:hypothetical protein
MKRISNLLLVLAVGGLLLVGFATAQTATTTTTTTEQTTAAPTAPPPPANRNLNVGPGQNEKGHQWENHVNNREEHQQDRIANGIKDGQLSAGQAAQLEKTQAKIQRQESRDEAANHGHLTPAEKAKFQREQNRQSRKIHNERHPKQ